MGGWKDDRWTDELRLRIYDLERDERMDREKIKDIGLKGAFLLPIWLLPICWIFVEEFGTWLGEQKARYFLNIVLIVGIVSVLWGYSSGKLSKVEAVKYGV